MPHKYGWLRSPLDRRDLRYSAPLRVATALPPSADLRSQDSPIDDQGALGSCTANAIGAALEFDQRKGGAPSFTHLSRLQLYYDEREMEGTTDYDAGAYIRDGIKCSVKIGVAPESMWPYDISKFTVKPPSSVYVEAEKRQGIVYSRVSQNLCQMKSVLAQGWPFVFGFTVYESFESVMVETTGIVPMPGPNEEILGGHAVVAVGYDDEPRRFTVRNSWGSNWGDGGYCYMPYEYLLDPDLADDLWVIQSVEVP